MQKKVSFSRASTPTEDLPDVADSLLEFARSRKNEVKVSVSIHINKDVLAYYKGLGRQSVEDWFEQVLCEWAAMHQEGHRRAAERKKNARNSEVVVTHCV